MKRKEGVVRVLQREGWCDRREEGVGEGGKGTWRVRRREGVREGGRGGGRVERRK